MGRVPHVRARQLLSYATGGRCWPSVDRRKDDGSRDGFDFDVRECGAGGRGGGGLRGGGAGVGSVAAAWKEHLNLTAFVSDDELDGVIDGATLRRFPLRPPAFGPEEQEQPPLLRPSSGICRFQMATKLCGREAVSVAGGHRGGGGCASLGLGGGLCKLHMSKKEKWTGRKRVCLRVKPGRKGLVACGKLFDRVLPFSSSAAAAPGRGRYWEEDDLELNCCPTCLRPYQKVTLVVLFHPDPSSWGEVISEGQLEQLLKLMTHTYQAFGCFQVEKEIDALRREDGLLLPPVLPHYIIHNVTLASLPTRSHFDTVFNVQLGDGTLC